MIDKGTGCCLTVKDFFFSYAQHFHVCAEYLFSFRRWGKLFRNILKCLRKNFGAVRVKQKCSFFIFCDRSQTILVKHPFPLSHIRALTILLFESMAIYKGPLQFVFDSSGTWKSKYKLSALTGLTLMQLPL